MLIGFLLLSFNANVFADIPYKNNPNNLSDDQLYGPRRPGAVTPPSPNQTTSTAHASDSSSTSVQTAPGVTLSSSAKDQEDLNKLFEHAKYEDFAKQKPVGGFSVDNEGAP